MPLISSVTAVYGAMVKLSVPYFFTKKSEPADSSLEVRDAAKRLDRIIGHLVSNNRCESCEVAVDELKYIQSALDKFVSRSTEKPHTGSWNGVLYYVVTGTSIYHTGLHTTPPKMGSVESGCPEWYFDVPCGHWFTDKVDKMHIVNHSQTTGR